MNSADAPPAAKPLTSFTCRACQQTFGDSTSQRRHFKTDEHVANVKRQLALALEAEPGRLIESLSLRESSAENTRPSDWEELREREVGALPPLLRNTVPPGHGTDQIPGGRDENVDDHGQGPRRGKDLVGQSHTAATALLPPVDASSEHEETDPSIPAFDPSRCLFCDHRGSDVNPNNPDSTCNDNIAHMQTAHGLLIPHQDQLIDLESFISYLFIVIFEFNECIHCGITKGSTRDIQRHMLTKQHCGIEEPGKDSEYRDFYDFSDSDTEDEGENEGGSTEDATETKLSNLVKSDETFVRLPSGRTLGHRSTTRGSRRDPHQRDPPETSSTRQAATAAGDNDNVALSNVEQSGQLPPRAGGKQLIARKNDEKGLVGVPEWQRRMIRATEVKLQKVEIRKRNRYEAAVQRAADERPDLRKRRTTRVPDSV